MLDYRRDIREQTKQQLLQFPGQPGQHLCRGFSHLRWRGCADSPWNKTTPYDTTIGGIPWSLEECNFTSWKHVQKHNALVAAPCMFRLKQHWHIRLWGCWRIIFSGRRISVGWRIRRFGWRIRLFGWRIIVCHRSSFVHDFCLTVNDGPQRQLGDWDDFSVEMWRGP